MKSIKKCIVKGCLNRSNEGKFVGELCGPCNTFITTILGVTVADLSDEGAKC